jgi:hypothetical protein
MLVHSLCGLCRRIPEVNEMALKYKTRKDIVFISFAEDLARKA